MTRKQFLSTSAAMASSAQAPAQVRSSGSAPKNVLFLLSDQHRPSSLGCAGDSVAKTPHLDSLARGGVRFTNAYCENPVCTPSRASLLTGLHTHHHQTWSNGTPWPFEHKTIAHHMGRAGYVTALIGKMHFVDAQTHGFDYRLDFNDWYQYLGPKTSLYAEEIDRANSGSGLPQINDLWKDFGDPWIGSRVRDNREGLVHIGRASQIAEQDHFESFVTRESVRFLERFGKKHPFFLISSFLKPHDPYMPAERFAKMFPVADMQLPDTYGKVDLANIPAEIRERIRAHTPTPELSDVRNGKMRIAMYYASLAQVDDCMGQILAKLRELDLEKNTVVLYSTDHGEMLGEHGLWQKFVFYDPSAGVPLIFRVPGLTPQDTRCATPVSLVQIVSTLLEICGVSAPAGLDGTSFAGNLREPANTKDAPVFAEFALHSKQARYMMRRGDFKYSHYVSDTPELYNLRDDPQEMKNLALDPAFKGKLQEMKSQLFAWHTPREISPGVYV
ncbi:MAG: sulfatase-like hydrolase/transferase [Bryobacteraceae bacterium]